MSIGGFRKPPTYAGGCRKPHACAGFACPGKHLKTLISILGGLEALHKQEIKGQAELETVGVMSPSAKGGRLIVSAT